MDRTLVADLNLAVHFTSKVQDKSQERMDTIHPEEKRHNDYGLLYLLEIQPSDLQQLNRCRIYLQATSLSDLVPADGRIIILPTLNGIQLIDRKSSLNWPTQQRPPKQAWKLWANALSRLHKGCKLHIPLELLGLCRRYLQIDYYNYLVPSTFYVISTLSKI